MALQRTAQHTQQASTDDTSVLYCLSVLTAAPHVQYSISVGSMDNVVCTYTNLGQNKPNDMTLITPHTCPTQDKLTLVYSGSSEVDIISNDKSNSSSWSPYVIGQTIIFSSCSFFLSFFFFFPRLISAVGDWMSTILLHIAWLQCEFRIIIIVWLVQTGRCRPDELAPCQ